MQKRHRHEMTRCVFQIFFSKGCVPVWLHRSAYCFSELARSTTEWLKEFPLLKHPKRQRSGLKSKHLVYFFYAAFFCTKKSEKSHAAELFTASSLESGVGTGPPRRNPERPPFLQLRFPLHSPLGYLPLVRSVSVFFFGGGRLKTAEHDASRFPLSLTGGAKSCRKHRYLRAVEQAEKIIHPTKVSQGRPRHEFSRTRL